MPGENCCAMKLQLGREWEFSWRPAVPLQLGAQRRGAGSASGGAGGEGSPSRLHVQRYKARTSPPSSQNYDTILKRENMFFCGQTADQLFAHVFCCDLFYFFNQCS